MTEGHAEPTGGAVRAPPRFAPRATTPATAGRLLAALALLLPATAAAAPAPPAADEPLTLERALDEARAANARLPVSTAAAGQAAERYAEARAARGPQLSVEGDFRYAPPGAYGIDIPIGEDRLQIVARQPIYDGGALASAERSAGARAVGARARARADEKDLDQSVREQFAGVLAGEEELAARDEALDRLARYLALVEGRAAAGDGVGADLLRTRARLAAERGDAAAARRRLDGARASLADLLGRPPGRPLRLAPLAAPPPPSPDLAAGEPPELAEARAEVASAEAEAETVRAERRPHLDLEADAGFWGLGFATIPGAQLGWGSAQLGASAGLNLTWPLLDAGLHRARLAQAALAIARSRAARALEERQIELARVRTRVDEIGLSAEIEARREAVQASGDALVAEESLYRGGRATALEVLDAFASWRDARLALVGATLALRVAEAARLRWSTP